MLDDWVEQLTVPMHKKGFVKVCGAITGALHCSVCEEMCPVG